MERRVEIDEMPIGSILNEDVSNAQGMILLKKGVVLEEKHSKILKRWGIKKVAIIEVQEGVSAEEANEEVLAQKEQEVKEYLDEIFQDQSTDELMMELKEAVLEIRLNQLRTQ